MKHKITLFAGALVLAFSASAAQAHGSLFGIFFKHHYHNACGYHHNDHRTCVVVKHKKVKKVQRKRPAGYRPAGHYHSHYYHRGHYHANGKKFIW